MLEPPPVHPATSRPARPLLLLIILLAFALRSLTLDTQSLWRDEVDAVWFALRPLDQTLSMFTSMAQNGPLYFLALRPWLQVVGATEFALRYPSVFAGVLAAPLLWQVARALLGRRQESVALLATLFLALNPYALWYGQEGKMYAWVLALALVATWCWLRGAARGGWVWAAYFLSISLALYTHLLTILILPLHLLWFVIAWPAARLHWKGFAAALAALFLPWLPMLAWQWDMLRAAEIVTGFQATPLLEMAKTTWLNQARGFGLTESLWLAAPILFVALVGLALGATEIEADADDAGLRGLSPWRILLLVATWAVAPLLLIWAVSLRQPVFTDRYLIWSLPAFLILLGLGIQVIRHGLGRAGPAAAALALSAILGVWCAAIWQQTQSPAKYDLRAAVRFVEQRRTPDDLMILQIPHLEWAYRYYSGDWRYDPFADSEARMGNWAGGLWTNYGADDQATAAEVDKQMRALTAGQDEVWLVLSEAEMWDQRRLMDAWLARHGQVTESADFRGAQVRRFNLNGD